MSEGPADADGVIRLWDSATGKLQKTIPPASCVAPKLKGKIHVYVGDGDDYFLNNAVRLLATAARQFDPPFDGEIVFGPAAGHGFGIFERRQMFLPIFWQLAAHRLFPEFAQLFMFVFVFLD